MRIRLGVLIASLLLLSVDVHARALSAEEVDARYQGFLAGTYEPDGTIFSPSTGEKESFNVLWKNHQWEDLARAVIRSKPYHSDLIWFYLGEAAGGLGNEKSAASYYTKAVADATTGGANARCSSIKLFGKDYCFGFAFPQDAAAKLGSADVAGASGAPGASGAVGLPGFSGPAAAQGAAQVDWKISDISLQDAASTAAEKIKKQYPKIQSRPESRPKLQVGPTQQVMPVIPYGVRYVAGYAELRKEVGKEAVAGLRELGNQSISFDLVYSFTNPTKLLLVSRVQRFARAGNFDDAPTSDTMRSSLIEKYGAPATTVVQQQRPVDLSGGKQPDPFNLVTMTWYAGNTSKRGGARNDIPENGYPCAELGRQLDSEGLPQEGTINRINSTGGLCGTVLIYKFSVYAGDRVADASAMLFEGERILDDWNQYVRGAAGNAKAQEQKDIQKRNTNKPAL